MVGTPGRFEVLLTAGAERDLESIFDYIAAFDSVASANYLLDQLIKAADSLAKLPDRGSHPGELVSLGIKEYRQMFFKPYRLIYRVTDTRVIIYVIADGRRDMHALLSRRLLGS